MLTSGTERWGLPRLRDVRLPMRALFLIVMLGAALAGTPGATAGEVAVLLSADVDAYQEALDLAVYLRKLIEERS